MKLLKLLKFSIPPPPPLPPPPTVPPRPGALGGPLPEHVNQG